MKYKDFIRDFWLIVAAILFITAICFLICFCVYAEERRVFTAEEVWSGEAARIIAEEEALRGKPLIPQLYEAWSEGIEVKIPYHTAKYYGIAGDMKEDEERLVLSINEDKMQMTTKRVKRDIDEEVTIPELLRDYLQEEIRQQKNQ